MTLEQAKNELKDTVRHELRDHAFGDREVTWMRGENELASGYFGSSGSEVSVGGVGFDGADARALLECGTLSVSRNDSSGPAEFVEGVIMPDLTMEDVRYEMMKEEEEVTKARQRAIKLGL